MSEGGTFEKVGGAGEPQPADRRPTERRAPAATPSALQSAGAERAARLLIAMGAERAAEVLAAMAPEEI